MGETSSERFLKEINGVTFVRGISDIWTLNNREDMMVYTIKSTYKKLQGACLVYQKI